MRGSAGGIQGRGGQGGIDGLLGPEIVPVSITANQNNYNPPEGWANCGIALLSSDAARDITGFVPPGRNSIVWKKTILNVGNFNITLQRSDVLSSEGNRIYTDDGADIVLAPQEGATLVYDAFTLFFGLTVRGGWRGYKLADSSAGAGVTSISINGGAARTGAIVLTSPMASNAAAQTIRLDNGNVKTLTTGASVGGVDTDLNNSFQLVAGQDLTIEKPTPGAAARDGEKITFLLTSTGAARLITFQGGVNGFRFADETSPQGVKLTEFNTLAALLDNTRFLKIGFEYSSTFSAWACVGLAGWFVAGA
jgi:hypothetical protein